MADSKSGKIVYKNTISDVELKMKDCSEGATPNSSEEVMEPMLLEDYNGTKLPLSLENLFNYSKVNGLTLDKNDIAAFFVYIMMLETGFVTSDYFNVQEITACNVYSNFHYQRFLILSKILPKNWKKDNLYTFTFILPPFVQHTCTVIGIVVSDDFIVNCSVKNIDNAKFCLLLDPSMYIVKCGTIHSTNMFQNLRALSIKLKSNISTPSKTIILQNYSLRSASLQGLPPEIILSILKYCDHCTFTCLKKTCKYLEKICLKHQSYL